MGRLQPAWLLIAALAAVILGVAAAAALYSALGGA
jgi:hypothetical protein